MSPTDRAYGRDVPGMSRARKPGIAGSRAAGSRAKPLDQGVERFSAGLVLLLMLGSTAIALYDAYLLRGLVVR